MSHAQHPTRNNILKEASVTKAILLLRPGVGRPSPSESVG
jgi:hypothetical protein